MVSCSVTFGSEQKFGIAVAACDWRRDNSEYATFERSDKPHRVVTNGVVNSGVAHNAFFHRAAASFELGLDQCDELRGSSGEGQCRWQDQFERYKADVDCEEVRRIVEPGRGQRANVGVLKRNDFRPNTQRVV